MGYQIYRDRSVKNSDVANGSRFAKIEEALRVLTATAAPQLQKAIDDSLSSALSKPAAAKDELMFTRRVIQQLSRATFIESSAVLARTSGQLIDIANAQSNIPETWATAAEFITYRSQVIAGWEQTNLPECPDKQGKASVSSLTIKDNVATVIHGPVKYSYCKIILDSPAATIFLGDLRTADIMCDHCVVFYSGGPIVVIQGVPIGKLIFSDCSFIFSLPSVPDPEGQRLVKTLLAATGNNFEFPLG